MNFTEYQKFAKVTKKPWDNKDSELAYLGLGLAGEAGEVVEIIKKHFSGSKPLDDERTEKLKNEIGDVMWYLAALCDGLGFDMGQIAQINIDKLRKRHGDTYSGYGKRE